MRIGTFPVGVETATFNRARRAQRSSLVQRMIESVHGA